MKKNKLIPYSDAKKILELQERGSWIAGHWKKVTYKIGLRSTHYEGCWCNSTDKVSYLEIVDEKKYLLAKLKYGI